MSVKYSIGQIISAVQQVMKKYDESDPFRLADAMGIMVKYRPMGTYKGCNKGFFLIHCRIKCIVINSDLPKVMQRIILAHELGHAVLHSQEVAIAPFRESELFDTTDPKEYEANLFASELLLQDEDIMEAVRCDHSVGAIAREFYVPLEMLDFKCRVMKKKGYPINPLMIAQSNFLKNLEKEADSCCPDDYIC